MFNNIKSSIFIIYQAFSPCGSNFVMLTYLPKYAIIQNRLPRGQKKRFYFNVLKRQKKQIIKRAETKYIHKKT